MRRPPTEADRSSPATLSRYRRNLETSRSHSRQQRNPGRRAVPGTAGELLNRSPQPGRPGTDALHLPRADVNDTRTRVIVAAPRLCRYATNRAAPCACTAFRTPLDCDCQTLPGDACGQWSIALENACDAIYCLYDQWPHCAHQRETCHEAAIQRSIGEQYVKQTNAMPRESLADVLYTAIAEELGANSGEAPDFSITRRSICHLLGGNPKNKSWTAPGGSVLRFSRPNPTWLTTGNMP